MKDQINSKVKGRVDGLISVAVRVSDKEPVLTVEPVEEADYSEVLSEFYRDQVLRKGRPHVPLSDMSVTVIPLRERPNSTRCLGFRLESQGEPACAAEYGIQGLEWVARRAAGRLSERKILSANQPVTYELVASVAEDESRRALRCKVETRPVTYLEVPLRSLLRQAQPRQDMSEESFHVFYTASAINRAERFARQGALDPRRVETGGVLVGFLCSCPETGEFFSVVSDVFEVKEAEEQVFSLSYTSRSWSRVRHVVQTRQLVQPAVRLLGQCHGHNFLPNGGKTCAECRQRPVCTLTNVFVSHDDQNWSRAVFCRQPWQLCHIFGLSARGDQIEALHTLRNGRLSSRGYWVMPSFDSARWPARTGG